jgi:hypothetical protein
MLFFLTIPIKLFLHTHLQNFPFDKVQRFKEGLKMASKRRSEELDERFPVEDAHVKVYEY